ncbi:DUF1642 domain-containing protein [Enterococcus lactis]|uniref:DUF1642 domain-containing protein n=1 Tax=Enterococcus lactis TaxID=357441 RepID=UPI0031CD67DD
MNKQEVIKNLESIKVIGNDALAACYNESINAGITLMKKLDEPQKPVIPQLVAGWLEKSTDPFTKAEKIAYLIKSKDGDSYYFCDWFVRDGIVTQEQGEELLAWVTRQSYETLLSLYNGYEVEKEPLYTVTINLDRKYHLVVDEGDGNDEISTTLTTGHGVLGYRYFLTEKEIKSADENLWLIAVPVEKMVVWR